MTTGSAIRHFTLDLDDLEWTGNDLVRPESVVAEPDGTLWASDARGGATRIDPGGGQSFLGGWGGEPNGLAIDPSGDLVTANIALGLVQRMTREDQWWPAVAHPRPDGFIVLVDERGARIVADGIYGTNEARLDPDERHLYVAETMKARILRFPVGADGSTFDAEGNLWVTTVVRNGLGVLDREGDWHVVFEDPREDVLATFADKLRAGTGEPQDMLAAAGPTLQFPTSVC